MAALPRTLQPFDIVAPPQHARRHTKLSFVRTGDVFRKSDEMTLWRALDDPHDRDGVLTIDCIPTHH